MIQCGDRRGVAVARPVGEALPRAQHLAGGGSAACRAPLRPTASQRTSRPWLSCSRARAVSARRTTCTLNAPREAAIARQDEDARRCSARAGEQGLPVDVGPGHAPPSSGRACGRRTAAAPRSAPGPGAAWSRDELERLRDLARVADGADPPLDVLLAGHRGSGAAPATQRRLVRTSKPCLNCSTAVRSCSISSSPRARRSRGSPRRSCARPAGTGAGPRGSATPARPGSSSR